MSRVSWLLMATVAVWMPQAATAQADPVVGIAEQARPDYAPIGVPLGSFLLLPSLAVDLRGDDNVRATQTDRRSDVILLTEPRLLLRSDWGRHALTLDGYLRDRRYARLGREQRTDFGASAAARADLRSQEVLGLDLGADRLTQPRDDINAVDAAARPVRFTRLRGSLSYASRGPLMAVEADIGAERRDYADAATRDGSIIDQDYRDVTRVEGDLAVSRRISGGLGLVGAMSVNVRDYARHKDAVDRTSRGGRVEAGVRYVDEGWLDAELRVGYLVQSYRSPLIRNVDGFSLAARVRWNLRPDMTLRADAVRRVEESASPRGSGLLRTGVEAGLDYELVHNIVASAEVDYVGYRYAGTMRRADERAERLSIRYLLSRLTSMRASIEHVDRSATFTGDRYHATRVSAGIVLTR